MRRSRMEKGKGLTLANKRIILRGAEFRTVEMQAKNKVCTVRCDIACHITELIAEEMGWEIYSGGHLIGGLSGTTPLEGELFLERIKLDISGGRGLFCAARSADSFKLTRAKAEDDDGMVTTLRFRLISDSWQNIVEYYGLMGQAAGQMALTLQPEQQHLQRKLGEDEGDAEESDEPAEDHEDQEAPETPVAAKRRGRPRKETADSEALQ